MKAIFLLSLSIILQSYTVLSIYHGYQYEECAIKFQDEVGVKNRRVIIGNVSKYIPADQRDKMSDQ